MAADGEAIAEAAEALVGARFRLHGRDPATGLDCVGVVALALRGAGVKAELPGGYTMKMRRIAQYWPLAERSGFAEVEDAARAGDVLLLELGPCQFHFAIAARKGGFVHAHAGLRRVVRTRELPAGRRMVGHWRLRGEDPVIAASEDMSWQP